MLNIHTILHPTDFSKCSEAALKLASGLARDYGAQIIIVHVAPLPATLAGGVMMAPMPSVDLSDVREQLRKLRPQGVEVPVQHVLVQGQAVDEILNAAKTHSCDMIVMGTHGRRALTRIVMGSTAENVVRRAPCAVVTVRQSLTQPIDDPELETAGAAKGGEVEC